MKEKGYQHGFSKINKKAMYDEKQRIQKAGKIIAVLEDHYDGSLTDLDVLDIGCSTGIITNKLAESFSHINGIDIDKDAIEYARSNKAKNSEFFIQDSMNLGFLDNTFDVVICAHIYEHVPDSMRLMKEIRRVLKPGGVCYFAAGNRLSIIEAHYRLPLLSIMPKPMANIYIKILGRGESYYEDHRTLWGLRNLVEEFKIRDYTRQIIKDPKKYNATDMIKPGSLKHKISTIMIDLAYGLCPTYIWLLEKD